MTTELTGFEQVKIETDLFYQACDQIGLMIIQDMPALRPSQSHTLSNCTSITYLPNTDQQAEFDRQLEVLVNQHKSYPSIVTWVSFDFIISQLGDSNIWLGNLQ